jgi:hypothetical protein
MGHLQGIQALLVRFCHCDEVPDKNNLKEEIFFGSCFQRFQSIVTW